MLKHRTGSVTAFADHMRETNSPATSDPNDQATRASRDIGPLGTMLRLIVGVLLVGSIVEGQLASAGRLTSLIWLLGLLGFPALVLVWHAWRIRRNRARFSDTSPLSFVLSLVFPLAAYFIGWLVPPLWFTSDATLIFVGSSLVLAALRGSAGCEFLTLSNWILRRTDQLACAVFTPIDALERRRLRSRRAPKPHQDQAH